MVHSHSCLLQFKCRTSGLTHSPKRRMQMPTCNSQVPWKPTLHFANFVIAKEVSTLPPQDIAWTPEKGEPRTACLIIARLCHIGFLLWTSKAWNIDAQNILSQKGPTGTMESKPYMNGLYRNRTCDLGILSTMLWPTQLILGSTGNCPTWIMVAYLLLTVTS